ncbi:MAG: HD domain-containing protein [Candidatus Aminicenantes bacterium]|nr:MAG: HD domain-containing protein [Candidatus Aminicenantes bacterium]
MKKKPLNFQLKDFFIDIFKEKAYLVGGTIRDYLLYNEISEKRDIDLVVIDHTYEEIEKKLKKYGKTNTVGKSFAVVKFTKNGHTFDISVPRKDIKKDLNSHGHKNFIIEYGPHIKLEEDLKRRDFTCNSIALRLIDDEMVDPFDGTRAAREKRLMMTGPETFTDDPLRILRAARFASVHRFTIDERIYINSKGVNLDEISKERITEELFRLLLESEKPSIGLNEYFKLTVLEKLFPPLYPLTLTIQDSIFHPEKDPFGHHTVWAHTLITIDIAKRLALQFELNEEQALALLLAVLFHDVGKAETTKWEFKRGRMTITSMFHDSRGVEITDEFLDELKIVTRKNFPLKQAILNLVKYHHRIYDLYRNREGIGFRAISRLVKDLEEQDLLLMLLDFADRRSREPDPLDFDDVDEIVQWYLKKKEEYNINKETIQPIIMGRDLVKLGVPPGVQMGEYLRELYERQLDGEFDTKEEGLKIFEKMTADER